MTATPKCSICGDTGKRPGSDYLDCSCDAPAQRLALAEAIMVHANDYGGNMDDYGNDRSWFIHQRATHITEAQMQTMAQEYSAQIDDLSQQNIALTNDNRGMAAERELHMARIAELERQLAARAPQGSARERFEAWARAEGWTYFERLPSGNYEESYLESYWDVWQAARASTNKEGGND